MQRVRRCKIKSCNAVLSMYNPAPVCFHHPEHPKNKKTQERALRAKLLRDRGEKVTAVHQPDELYPVQSYGDV